jgi:DNA-binding protein WhiA
MKLRDELVQHLPEATCCRSALFAGVTAGLPAGGGTLTTANAAAAYAIVHLGKVLAIAVGLQPLQQGFALAVPSVISASLRKRCCRRAWLKGTFILGGALTDPRKAYNLEWAGSHGLMMQIRAQLDRESLHPKLYERTPAHWILYSRNASEIATILALIGAMHALLEFEDLRSEKELSNKIHRQVNYEVANYNKSVATGLRQIDEIARMRDLGLLDALPESLRATAILRETHPYASLVELCALSDPPVSKSGMNHRLRKLHLIMQEYTEASAQTATSAQN